MNALQYPRNASEPTKYRSVAHFSARSRHSSCKPQLRFTLREWETIVLRCTNYARRAYCWRWRLRATIAAPSAMESERTSHEVNLSFLLSSTSYCPYWFFRESKGVSSTAFAALASFIVLFCHLLISTSTTKSFQIATSSYCLSAAYMQDCWPAVP